LRTSSSRAQSLFAGLPALTLPAAGARPSAAAPRLPVNAHIHLPPNFSAFDTVEQAVGLAAAEGIAALGASNYYDYTVYQEFAERAAGAGIVPLFGIEIITLDEGLAARGVKINDPGNPGKMYLCGKGISRFDPLSPEAQALLGTIRTKDAERMAAMTQRLAERFAAVGLETALDADAIKEQVVRRHGSPKSTVYLQERHVAQAFQESLFERLAPGSRADLLARLFGAPPKSLDSAAVVQNDIRSHLMKAGKAAYVEETFVGYEHARALILALGGIPCYPTLADGASPICEFEAPIERLLAEIAARDIHCAELIPVRNQPEALLRYATGLRRAALMVTAGTEHNTRESQPIAPACVNGQPIPDAALDIFWEGACVVAAHHYRVFRGQPGFVDEAGQPNPAYATAEGRIAAFRALGEEVIREFRRMHPA